jgi:hypothetical protein
MDTTNSFFPMDLGAMPMQTEETNGQPPASQAPHGTGNSLSNVFSMGGGVNGGVFMGVSTPSSRNNYG